jgi:hypothetical protein
MERTLEDLASEVLRLNVESRAALAKRLLDSLDELAPDENERFGWRRLRAATDS